MKTMKTDNEATLAKNESAIDRLRTDMAQLRTGIFIQMVGVISVAVAILGGLITFLRFFT